MDPESYFVSSEVAKLDREKELAKYDLFPMYPTGQPHFPALFRSTSQPQFWSVSSFPSRRERRSRD